MFILRSTRTGSHAESAATARKGRPQSQLRQLLSVILFSSCLFFASLVLTRFHDALSPNFDFVSTLVIFIALELLFRGFVQTSFGFKWQLVAFPIVYFAIFGLGEPVLLLQGLLFAGFLGLLRMREGLPACILSVILYLAFVYATLASSIFASAVLSLLFLSLPLYLAVSESALPHALASLGLTKKNLFRNIAYGAVSTILLLLVLLAVSLAASALGFNDLSNSDQLIRGAPQYILVMAVLFSPLAEEIFFRGFIYSRFGILASSLLFALAHFTYSSNLETLAAFIAGISFCLLYKRTGSLVGPIVSHMLFNLLSLTLLFGV